MDDMKDLFWGIIMRSMNEKESVSVLGFKISKIRNHKRHYVLNSSHLISLNKPLSSIVITHILVFQEK